jgi:hypothetical protein
VHTIEVLAMGGEMRREAMARCPNVNQAHFMVHEVMLEILADPAVVSRRTARALLFARLDAKLMECEIVHAKGLTDARALARID